MSDYQLHYINYQLHYINVYLDTRNGKYVYGHSWHSYATCKAAKPTLDYLKLIYRLNVCVEL